MTAQTLTPEIKKLARAIERSAVHEDRLEYSPFDLARCYQITRGQARELYVYLHRNEPAAL